MKNAKKWLIAGLAIVSAAAFSLTACQKTSKLSSAGGGSSSQSVMTIRGSTR